MSHDEPEPLVSVYFLTARFSVVKRGKLAKGPMVEWYSRLKVGTGSFDAREPLLHA